MHMSERDIREGRITERHVQAIWYDRDLRPACLETRDGAAVRVVHPGEWNAAAGPDFKGAVLEIGPRRHRVVGDVEVHLVPSDWDAHGHASDPAYRQVVAHVTWRNGAPPASLPKNAVSICLGRYFAGESRLSVLDVDTGVYPFGRMPAEERPCRRRAERDPESIRRMVADAGRWRLMAKSARMAALLKAGNPQQVFYSEVMGALGYGGNSEAFRTIAAAVPFAVLMAEPESACSALCTAATFVTWRDDRVRPGNLPMRRLKAAARLFAEANVMAMADVGNVSKCACKAILAGLTAEGCVGRGRAAAIIANVIVPYAMACGHISSVPDWLPPEDISTPVRRIASRMFGGDHNPRVLYAANGLMIQGLIQIDREWCMRLHPECASCAVSETHPF